MEANGGENPTYQQKEVSFVDKYGGIVPKKKPLISKDTKRAYFDSADWALGKQETNMDQKATVNVETLRPKLQRTHHHRVPPRRPSCTSGGDNKGY